MTAEGDGRSPVPQKNLEITVRHSDSHNGNLIWNRTWTVQIYCKRIELDL